MPRRHIEHHRDQVCPGGQLPRVGDPSLSHRGFQGGPGLLHRLQGPAGNVPPTPLVLQGVPERFGRELWQDPGQLSLYGIHSFGNYFRNGVKAGQLGPLP